MKIIVLSKMYNEEDLLPIFLNHYSFADKIIIYLEKSTTDNSEKIILSNPKTEIIYGGESDGKLNDAICANELSRIATSQNADWVICVDADEFVFPQNFEDPRKVLADIDDNLIYSHMWNVFPHVDEAPLDLKNLSIMQRRHGDPNIIHECKKPNIIKPETNIQWEVGGHAYYPNPKIKVSSYHFCGVHWQSADLELACKRRIINIKPRLSQENINNKWAIHNFNVTREMIAEEIEHHKYDPQLF